MRALDLAVAVWTIIGGLYVVGATTGYLTVSWGPIIGLSDIQEIMVGGGSPLEALNALVAGVLGSLLLAGLATRLLGINAVAAVISLMVIAFALFLFGRAVYYALNWGSLVADLLAKAFPGLAVPPEAVMLLNAVAWVVAFMALVDVWRGVQLRYAG